jgi:hypothetical protein
MVPGHHGGATPMAKFRAASISIGELRRGSRLSVFVIEQLDLERPNMVSD